MNDAQPLLIPGTVLDNVDFADIAVIQPEDITAMVTAWKRRNSGRYENLIDAPVIESGSNNVLNR